MQTAPQTVEAWCARHGFKISTTKLSMARDPQTRCPTCNVPFSISFCPRFLSLNLLPNFELLLTLSPHHCLPNVFRFLLQNFKSKHLPNRCPLQTSNSSLVKPPFHPIILKWLHINPGRYIRVIQHHTPLLGDLI